jgi:preprotein translocase subunit YajC
MFATPAVLEQITAGGGAETLQQSLMQYSFIPLMLGLFYFLLIRPQQKRAKEHQAAVGGIKRGDTVVLSSGVIGKIVRVEEGEVGLEIAQGVTIKVVKSMIAEVRTRSAPAAANDAKS